MPFSKLLPPDAKTLGDQVVLFEKLLISIELKPLPPEVFDAWAEPEVKLSAAELVKNEKLLLNSQAYYATFEFNSKNKLVADIPPEMRERDALGFEVVQRLYAAIPPRARYPITTWEEAHAAIIAYNDAPGRTAQEIIEWYERALVLE